MRKLSISTKSLLWVIFAALVLALTSCSTEELTIEDNNPMVGCITDGIEDLIGSYASRNSRVVYTISSNATISVRQDGILNGVSSFCFTPDGSYLKLTNEYNQVEYINYSVVYTQYTKGIVLGGEFYESVN